MSKRQSPEAWAFWRTVKHVKKKVKKKSHQKVKSRAKTKKLKEQYGKISKTSKKEVEFKSFKW